MSLTNSSFYIQNNGTVKACGYNNEGQLGLGDKSIRHTPTSILNLNDIKNLSDFVFIADNYYFIKQNGEYFIFDENGSKITISDSVLNSLQLIKENGYISLKKLNNDILNHEIKDFSVVKAIEL